MFSRFMQWLEVRRLVRHGEWKTYFLTGRDAGWIALCRFGVDSEIKRIGKYTLLRPRIK